MFGLVNFKSKEFLDIVRKSLEDIEIEDGVQKLRGILKKIKEINK